MAPSAISAVSRLTTGLQYVHIASIRKRPRSRASATSSSASRELSVNAFSHSTCFPAFRQSAAASRCAECGVATYTTSTSSSAASSAQLPYALGIPNRSAKALAEVSVREATATTSVPGTPCRSAVKVAAIPPVASTPQRTVLLMPAPKKVSTTPAELRA